MRRLADGVDEGRLARTGHLVHLRLSRWQSPGTLALVSSPNNGGKGSSLAALPFPIEPPLGSGYVVKEAGDRLKTLVGGDDPEINAAGDNGAALGRELPRKANAVVMRVEIARPAKSVTGEEIGRASCRER